MNRRQGSTWIKATPQVLMRDGELDHPALRAERVTDDEIHAAVRNCGRGDLRDIAAIVLKTDGSFSVITPEG